MKVNFNLRISTPNDKPQPINAVIRWNAQRLVYSTSFKVMPKHWNADKQRVKSIDEPLKDKINNFLSNFESLVASFDADQKAKMSPVDTSDLKTYLDSIFKPKKEAVVIDEKVSLFGFIDTFINERTKHPTLYKTAVKYNQMRTFVVGYAKDDKRLIDFQHINQTFFDGFVKYLYTKKISQNYTNKIISLLKAVLNEATEKGYNSNQAYKSRKFNVSPENVQNVYLSIDELSELLDFDLSQNTRLERVRDLFLIGCYTGLRFSDFTNIKPENITKNDGIDCLEMTTIKTGQDVVIPLNPVVLSIFAKYNGKIPTPLSNQKMNDYLKEVCKLVGFQERVMITSTRAGFRIDVPYQKWELITTHTARRSFATNAFKSGIQAMQIMKITGHSSENSFKKYIKINGKENAVLLSNHSFFNGKQTDTQLKKVS
jgi:integrase